MIAASHIRWFPSQSYGEEISLKKTFFIYYLETVIYDRELWKTTAEERTLLKVIESESSRARFSRGQLQYLCNTLVLSGNLRKHAGLCKWSSQDASLGLLTTTTTKLLRENMYTVLGKKKRKAFYQKVVVYSSCWCNHHHHPSPEVFHLPKLKPSTHKSFVPFHTAPGNHHSTSCLIESDYCRFLM